MKIPTWEEAATKMVEDTASPLDLFIYDNEPVGLAGMTFRINLQELVDYILKQKEGEVIEK